MRKIEQSMIQAVRECLADPHFSGKYWGKDNTSVSQHHEPGPNGARYIEITLYDTVVGLIEPTAHRINLYTEGYRTATTKSRINALLSLTDGYSIFQKNNQWKYSRRTWDKDAEFYDGLCLGLFLP
jgi:hypothetical protein